MFIWGENAQFLQYISTFVGTGDGDVCSTPTDTRADFYVFYEAAHQLLNCFYPQRRITITSRDPYYITPTIKAKLRRKNRLRRAGRTEEANALALQIGKDIANRNKTRPSRINRKTCSKDTWAAVRWLTGPHQTVDVADGITAESLNQHHARISTDVCYQPPQRKDIRLSVTMSALSGKCSRSSLDKLTNTATGLDCLVSTSLVPTPRRPNF